MTTELPAEPDYWLDLLDKISLPDSMFIDGARVGTGTAFDLVTPRDGTVIARLPGAGASEVDAAVAGARRCFATGSWRGLTPRERGSILRRWADLLETHRDELAMLVTLEMGKPIRDAWSIELRTTIKTVRWYGEIADKLMDETPRGDPGSLALVTREPVGVVAAITPWNFPMTLSAFKVPAALAAGNSVVLKPAEQAPLSMVRAAELAHEAGLPAGALQVVTGAGAVAGKALARHDDVDTVTFTGSPGVGHSLLRDSGESNGKPVWLELGGKSAQIVFPDADLDLAADSIAWSIAFNAGQMCTAGSRLLVHEQVHATLLDRVADRLSAVVTGDPLRPETELGPLASARHRAGVLAEVEAGIARGNRLVTGSAEPDPRPGWFVDPVVFDHVDPADRLAQHEIFGPVLAVTPFRGEAEAVALANGTRYGLAAGVWTDDLNRAHRVARAMDTGLVWVNCYEEGDQSVPFGGRKLSGYGTDKAVHGLEKFTQLKTTWIQLHGA